LRNTGFSNGKMFQDLFFKGLWFLAASSSQMRSEKNMSGTKFVV
jgi:hypothetical protein